MEQKDLRNEIMDMREPARSEYMTMMQLTCIGGNVRQEYSKYAEHATCADEFFDNIFSDDERRMDLVWAKWAKLKNKPWIHRFSPTDYREAVYNDTHSMILRNGDDSLLIPVPGRATRINALMFEDEGFNEHCAEFLFSFRGHYEVDGMILDGEFDVFRTDGAVIFERWAYDEENWRTNRKGDNWRKDKSGKRYYDS